jgi:hypothetical protein
VFTDDSESFVTFIDGVDTLRKRLLIKGIARLHGNFLSLSVPEHFRPQHFANESKGHHGSPSDNPGNHGIVFINGNADPVQQGPVLPNPELEDVIPSKVGHAALLLVPDDFSAESLTYETQGDLPCINPSFISQYFHF